MSSSPDERLTALDQAVPLQGMLGYLNFSAGKPDPRVQKQINEAYAFLAQTGSETPWTALPEHLLAKLESLKASSSSAFQDVSQARAVITLLPRVLQKYRQHHADLLFYLPDRDLFQPFFLARVMEAILAQGPPWRDEERIAAGAVAQVNDFVGHRPVAILENRPRGEPYDHERVRPIPLYLKGAGVGFGQYHDLLARALDILRATEPAILAEAQFDLDLLDELALDPRAYDQGHPVNRRPNYIFGEWDPHHIDNQGRYRRFVVRGMTLDALLDRVDPASELDAASGGRQPPVVGHLSNVPALDTAEALYEAAAVLAGTILMASGISGAGPAAHDSSMTLTKLREPIARYRDTFYQNLLEQLSGPHGERLREEAARLHLPFGAARQHLNDCLARHRALQLQQRYLSLLFAEMGYPDAGRQEAAAVPAASVRLLSEMVSRLVHGHMQAEHGALQAAGAELEPVEALLHRGIACGALPDPWNILGFQGLFPLFQAQEDTMHDPRIDDLIRVMLHVFNLYSRVMSDAAAAGDRALVASLMPRLEQIAAWWDQFASVEIQDVRRVHGAEVVESTRHVVTALERWHDHKDAADLAFWKEHLEGFRSPKAFALVVEALLRKQVYRSAMALLMNWIGQAEQVPLDDGIYSFHALTLRWMLAVLRSEDPAVASLVPKFFDYLEANAEDFWLVPSLELESADSAADAQEEDLYGAAYEDVTFQDSADDEVDSEVLDGGGPAKEFDLELEGDYLIRRLRFLSTLARLWNLAAHWKEERRSTESEQEADPRPAPLPLLSPSHLRAWLGTAQGNHQRLLALLDAIQAHPIPEPLGSYDSMVEYDRRRGIKEQLLEAAIATCLDTSLAAGALRGACGSSNGDAQHPGPAWEPVALQIEQALWRGDSQEAARLMPDFIELFKPEPLLARSIAQGGEPRDILRVRLAQNLLRALVANFPRLGLLKPTLHLLLAAWGMEKLHPTQGPGVSEFSSLFQAGYSAVIDAVVDSAAGWEAPHGSDHELAGMVETITSPFVAVWVEHSRTLQLATLETLRRQGEWDMVLAFVKRYGRQLFHARFMTLANLRGILHRGVDSYLDYLRDNPDPLQPLQLIDDLAAGTLPRPRVVRHLQIILYALVENYEEYKDYKSSTVQSDYGDNLYMLLDFLRLKASYERYSWQFRPLVMAHEVLARKNRSGAAVLWQGAFAHLTQSVSDQHLEELRRLEQAHGFRLRTLADRLEERFVKPLALDRLCALIRPAMQEAHEAGDKAAFARLRQEMQAFTATPAGVGLDLPAWLLRLEQEVQRVRAAGTALAVMAGNFLQVPRKSLSYSEFREQLQEFEKLSPKEPPKEEAPPKEAESPPKDQE
jgi:hypothetical protein